MAGAAMSGFGASSQQSQRRPHKRLRYSLVIVIISETSKLNQALGKQIDGTYSSPSLVVERTEELNVLFVVSFEILKVGDLGS